MNLLDENFYLCARGNTFDSGIYQLAFDAAHNIVPLGFTHLNGCSYAAFSPDRRAIYATCFFPNAKGGAGGVAAFNIMKDGSLMPNGDFPTGQNVTPAYICVSPTHPKVYLATYTPGVVTELDIDDTGAFSHHAGTFQGRGAPGPHPTRQEESHMHCVEVTPDGKHLAAVDLGTDSVCFYPLDDKGHICGEPAEHKVAPGDGPRHILFAKGGKLAYIINELSNTVAWCDYADGKLAERGRVSTLPENCATHAKAAAVRFAADGKQLLATTRGFEADIKFGVIARYDIAVDGSLSLAGITESGGNSPRDVAELSRGTVAVGNEFSGNLCLFPKSGKMASCDFPGPICILRA